MYFLSKKMTDTSWRIQALRIKGPLITGFNTMSDQMFLLPFLCEAINEAGSAGIDDCSLLMKKITPDSTRPYRLVPDKKILKTLYSEFFRFHPEGELMLKTDTLTEIIPQQKSETFIPEELNEEIETTMEESIVSVKLYPNPVKADLTIEPEDDGRYICKIINTSGTTVLNKTINGKQILNVSELQNGQYYLRISDNQWNVSTYQFIKVPN
ncbi:MAG: T9SS type A sorting domain-containing protein [Bacteroidales bacterium]|nr:T9SS type A sorting domain-containing protein [Bacteroidales bacterium]